MNSSRTGRRHVREFKNNAVARVRNGRTVTDVARDLGVSKWSLGRWVEQARAGPEREYVSRQRDILKKSRRG